MGLASSVIVEGFFDVDELDVAAAVGRDPVDPSFEVVV